MPAKNAKSTISSSTLYRARRTLSEIPISTMNRNSGTGAYHAYDTHLDDTSTFAFLWSSCFGEIVASEFRNGSAEIIHSTNALSPPRSAIGMLDTATTASGEYAANSGNTHVTAYAPRYDPTIPAPNPRLPRISR
jgi:hypothetical protein